MEATNGNSVILDRSLPFEDRARRVLDHWAGGSERWLVDDLAFFLLYCWFLKHENALRFEPYQRRGEQRSGLADTPLVRDYVAASLAAVGGETGWNAILRQRGLCSCGQTNRLENMGICVECATFECWECQEDHRAASGHDVVG